MITFESASPGTSIPCQKLSAPKITLFTSALNASTIFDRGMPSLWAYSAMFRRANQGVSVAGGGLEHPVRREQDERLAVGLVEVVRDRPDRLPLEIGRLRRRGRGGSSAGGS